MSKLTNDEDRLRASLQDISGLGGAGFDLLLLARHMMESAELSSKPAETASRDSYLNKAVTSSSHANSSDAANTAYQISDHADGTAVTINGMREAAFGKITTSALQTNETQVPPHILNALLQLEKLPTAWVFKTGSIKDDPRVTHPNEYAPQSTEVMQLHDRSTIAPARQPVAADHDNRSTVSALTASSSSAPADHRSGFGDADHNAVSNDLSGGRPDLTSVNGTSRDLSAVSASRMTVASEHTFQSTTSFYSNDTASVQFSDSSRGSVDTDGAGSGRSSAVPALHGQNGFGSMSGSSFGTDATHQQMTVGGAPSAMAGNVTLPSIQPSAVSSDSTNLLVAHQEASANPAALPAQEIGNLTTDGPATADATNHQDLPVDVPGPEMHGSNSPSASANDFAETVPIASPTNGRADLLSSQAMSPSLDAVGSGPTSASAPVHEGSLVSGQQPDPAQTPDSQMQVPPAPSGVESAAGTPANHPADAAHLQPAVPDSEPPRPAIDSLSAHSATQSAPTPTDAILITTPNDPSSNAASPFSSSHGAPAASGVDGLPSASAVAPALESTGSDSGSAAPASHAAAEISADQSPLSSGFQHLAAGQDDSGTRSADPGSSLTQPDAHVDPVTDLINSLPERYVFRPVQQLESTGHLHGEEFSYPKMAEFTYAKPALNLGPDVEALRAHLGYLLGVKGFDNPLAAHPTDDLGSDPAHHISHELALDHSTPPPLPGLVDFHYDHPILDPGLGPDVHVDIQLWHSH